MQSLSVETAHHAQRVVDEIIRIVETLQTQPKMGRIVPELNQPQIREHFIYSYRIIYEIEDEQLHILAVIHGRRPTRPSPRVEVSEVRLSNGAGFIVAIAGNMMTMPGLPKVPAAEKIDVDADGNITGLF